jgi:hypothetical protein
MCGIIGLWQTDGAPVNRDTLQAMTGSIAHRGPDGEGLLAAGSIGLGHRRLAILDLSENGKQPMSYGSGRYWITFNGEIYNFLEVRAELEARATASAANRTPRSSSPPMREWGADCLPASTACGPSPSGTAQQRTLFLARDRFGKKPLFYAALPRWRLRLRLGDEGVAAAAARRGARPGDWIKGMTLRSSFAYEATEAVPGHRHPAPEGRPPRHGEGRTTHEPALVEHAGPPAHACLRRYEEQVEMLARACCSTPAGCACAAT